MRSSRLSLAGFLAMAAAAVGVNAPPAALRASHPLSDYEDFARPPNTRLSKRGKGWTVAQVKRRARKLKNRTRNKRHQHG